MMVDPGSKIANQLRSLALPFALIALLFCVQTTSHVMAFENAAFDVDVRDSLKPPFVRPARVIEMDPAYSGQWLVAGDLDGNGKIEFVSARNDNQAVTAVGAYEQNGDALWRGGEGNAGSARLGYDVPVQIYDLDGDGANEVWFSIEGALVVVDGKTGVEQRRIPLPDGLRVADCIAFADFRGRGRATDVIIKDRYHTIWAYTGDFDLLWTIKDPGGFKTCHQPVVLDIDGDGRDELMAGYAMVDDNGHEIWTVKSNKIDLARGHLDCARVVRSGKKPADFRLALTYCGAQGVAMVDGAGRTLWEHAGRHFESADVADVSAESPGLEIVVDVDHQPYGNSPTWVIGEGGQRIGTYLTKYGRHHDLVDWDGDGFSEIVLGHGRAICDGKGHRLATLAPEDAKLTLAGEGDPEPFVFVGDVTGDGREDVVLHSSHRIEIYPNPSKATPPRKARVGTGVNYTLY